MALPPLIQVTDTAIKHISALLAQSGKPVAGLKISLKTKGCSGLSYDVDYAETVGPHDEVVKIKTEGNSEISIIIDPKAIMHILGSEMDYEEGQWKSGFVFRNPNEKGRCGCGESFHV